ncbi:flagellar hook-basal body protein [Clostridium cylindrosporum]|uniref:Flagellar basal-body rod protein FlgG n=1 Tax=Clostridium cylindrosporum DSM 605 TaxID=1121307 RepID=A0A0J8D754_CLOCY|nr:flagellar hook-basal body complex protein [Clostridium cylindrosporum]KMT21722.1 flagellar basal-body rod protein FlgG [Clostridium cylindrosporum DSM 605]
MLSSIWTGRSGLISQQAKMDTVSNNVANSNTIGYKKIDVSFSETLKENIRQRNGVPFTNSDNMAQGTGTKVSKPFRNSKEGTFIDTGRDTDIAISGQGYFKVLDNSGNAYYTRDGSFSIDVLGNFVHSASGMKLEIQNYKKENLKQPVSISPDGNITSDGLQVGKINLYDFSYKNDMLSQGDNTFTSGERPKAPEGKMIQGYVEGSNVDMVEELTNMITTQRSYEFNSRSIKAADEMWQLINNLKSK